MIHGNRIALARAGRGLGREELAHRMDMTDYQLYRVEILGDSLGADQISKMLFALHYPVRFFEDDRQRFPPSVTSMRFHIDPDEFCQFCHTELVDALCDQPTGKGVTCDARLCDYCRTRPGPNTDYCPDHKQFAGQFMKVDGG